MGSTGSVHASITVVGGYSTCASIAVRRFITNGVKKWRPRQRKLVLKHVQHKRANSELGYTNLQEAHGTGRHKPHYRFRGQGKLLSFPLFWPR